MSQRAPNVDRLYSDIEWALAHGLPPRELVPMLEKLLRHAPTTSPHAIFAKRQLAELTVQRAPWRAARLARDVLDVLPEDDRAWALLGLAHTLLGHFHSAERAYREAVLLAPFSPWYAHNLGHLLDVALDRPKDALRYLLSAHKGLPHEPEIAASLAHALARANRWSEAVPLLAKAIGKGEAAAEEMLRDWLTRDPPGSLPEQAAPAPPPTNQELALLGQAPSPPAAPRVPCADPSGSADGSDAVVHGSADRASAARATCQDATRERPEDHVSPPEARDDTALVD